MYPMSIASMRWTVPFFALITLAVVGAFMPQTAPTVVGDPINAADTAWLLTASCLVLVMTPGLSFFYGGMVQKKNVISTMLQSIIAMGVISVLWVVFGFSLAFGDSIGGIIGDPRTFFFFQGVGGATHPALSPTIPLVLFAIFQLKFAIITPALITGAFAERVKFTSYVVFISLWSILIYAPLAHMTWHPEGFLRTHGVLDFAGGTVVHMSAGLAALVGASFLGKRKEHSPQQAHEPANIPFVILGTGLLWFGWFGFNAGSALASNDLAAQAFLTTNTASASAMLTWVFFDGMRGRKPSAIGACVGAVVGLVAITPAAGFVSVGASIFIGVTASIVSNFAVYWKSRSSLDDTLDVFPCHGVGGMVGMLLTAVFAKDVGLVHGGTSTLIWHVGTLIGVSIFVIAGSWILYKVSDAIIPLRVSHDEEEAGLDLSQHGETIGA